MFDYFQNNFEIYFQAFLTENFEAIVETLKMGAPADTRLIARLEQLEESARSNGEKLEKIKGRLDSQEEVLRTNGEKLDKISERLDRHTLQYKLRESFWT